jgi:hypothetical protein
VRAGFQRDKYTTKLQRQRFNNRTEDASELELDYLPRSGSTVGLVARHVKGKYPSRARSARFLSTTTSTRTS